MWSLKPWRHSIGCRSLEQKVKLGYSKPFLEKELYAKNQKKKPPILIIILFILASILRVATYAKRTSVKNGEMTLNSQRAMGPTLTFPLDEFLKLPERQLCWL